MTPWVLAADDWQSWVLALGVGAVLAELVRSGFQRRKMSADAAKVITDAATVLLGPLHDRVHELEGEIQATRQELNQARRELDGARTQVQALTRELEGARADLAALRGTR